MPNQQLRFACLQYDHTLALFDGSVKVEGHDVKFETAKIVTEIIEPMLSRHAFDASELGLTYYLRLLDEGNCPFVALPIFLARTFRQSSIFINKASGIKRPQDLAGKLIGEFGLYGHDAGIWAKGFLADEFGLRPNQCCWVIGASDWYMPPFDFIPQRHPPDVDVKPVERGKVLGTMLDHGEIDAFISSRIPKCVVEHSPNVSRLFPDYQAVERRYYERTRIFPIMHTLIVRKDVLSKTPDLPTKIYASFTRAKEVAIERYREGMAEQNVKSTVPWLTPLLEENDQLFQQDDWWPYGVAANRHAIDTFARYAFEQGIVRKQFTCEELFVKELLDT